MFNALNSNYGILILAVIVASLYAFDMGVNYRSDDLAQPIGTTVKHQTVSALSVDQSITTKADFEKQTVVPISCLEQVSAGNFLCLSNSP